MRRERDPLGEREVPAHALWGIQTLRAQENFPISGLRPHPAFVDAVVRIKRAAAIVHRGTGRLEAPLADAIIGAATAILDGAHRDQFVVDPFQAGAGTSHNMNVNEVLANLANRALGAPLGAYAPVHPNDHVNMAQSTNDVIPTAIRLAALAGLASFHDAAARAVAALDAKARDFDGIVKAGRTHLQDAMPIRLGQEFGAWAGSLARAEARITEASAPLHELGIGGSAVGTGVNVEPAYPAAMVAELARDTGLALTMHPDRVQAMQSMGDVAAMHAMLRVFAVELSRIASDLRLIASGPRTGLDELRLPAVQPGSSIMPGKVNPSILEMVNQVCLQVMGHDHVVSAAAEHGQLELNVMMPVIAHDVLHSLSWLTNALTVLTDRCLVGITANAAQNAYWVERSTALVTALAPAIGYARAASLAKRAVEEDVAIRTLVVREGVLSAADADRILDLARLTRLGVPGRDA
ncbi:MAG: aspartate ammonia-lyase [Gemmatimonadaceae bacterium]|nr:aspartate ammonia-lyase [Gemmatimonadaceae bacterium]